jgi:DNA invertase Pin-like site-specific DNA recombinase
MSLQDAAIKIRREHLEKLAYVYVRQSTPGGVKKNIVGGQRQRDMHKVALELGWREENIRVIEKDQARSGSSTEGRVGYVEMLNDIMDGRVGAVFSLESARVGRDTADWHFLIKMCDLSETLVIDPDGAYDARDCNDWSLMSIKAMLSQLELRWITQRLIGAKRELAKKGELRFFLPTGFVYDEDNKIVIDPDPEVQKAVRLFFTLFKQFNSASGVARYFNANGLTFPTIVRGGPRKGEYVWHPLWNARALSILHNPIYAGTYVFGRSKTKKRAVRKNGSPVEVKYKERLGREEWENVIHDAHPSYITWEEYLRHERQLESNRNLPRAESSGAPRSGAALIQGLALCGKCGRKMYVSYPQSPAIPYYNCVHARLRFGAQTCQTMPGDRVDYVVEEELLAALKPAQLEMSLEALGRVEAQNQENERQWKQRVRRAEEAVAEACDRLLAIDPKNRRAFTRIQELLEERDSELARLKREREDGRNPTLAELSPEEQRSVLALAQDFPRVWRAKTTDNVTRKSLLRCLISDITLTREVRIVRIGIRWATGAQTSLEIELPSRNARHRLPARVLEFIKKLSPDYTNRQIAEVLNSAGILNGRGGTFTKKRVKRIRERYGIKKHPLDCSREQRDDGRYSAAAVARLLAVHQNSVDRWCREERLDGVKDGPGKGWWVKTTPAELVKFEKGVRRWSTARSKKDKVVAPVLLLNSGGDGSALTLKGVAL